MHTCFLLCSSPRIRILFSPLKTFAIVFSGLCHDVGHTGFTNLFEIASQSKKAITYNDSSVNFVLFSLWKISTQLLHFKFLEDHKTLSWDYQLKKWRSSDSKLLKIYFLLISSSISHFYKNSTKSSKNRCLRAMSPFKLSVAWSFILLISVDQLNNLSSARLGLWESTSSSAISTKNKAN